MKSIKKIIASLLVFAMSVGMMDTAANAKTKKSGESSGELLRLEENSNPVTGSSVLPSSSPIVTATPTIAAEKVVTITPFAGQWKYYGQVRNFVLDTNYATSDDNPLPDGVSLKIEADTVGNQKFYVEDMRSDEEKRKIVYELDKDAPTYEIKNYITSAKVEEDLHIYNEEDKKRAEEGDIAVSGSATTVTTTTMKKIIEAPKGFYISPSIEGENVEWRSGMEVELKEGENTFTYYLRSNQNNDSRKAIDQTPKSIVLKADWTAPEIVSIVGGNNSTDVASDGQIISNEPGTFYYVVVPENHAELTKEDIEANVGSHYGIVGFGRVDGTTKATDFSFSGLMANRNYTIYAYMEDDAENCSPVKKSNLFATDLMALAGNVEISGTMAVDQILTAKTSLDSVATGKLSYQWYRIKNAEDASSIDEIWDETGGAEEDDLEAEEDEEDDEKDDENDDTVEINALSTFQDNDEDITTIDGATIIQNATQETYQVTRDDIGYRLICRVEAEKYSGYIAGKSSTFVPKLLPQYTIPTMAAVDYSPTLKLSSLSLPKQWSWVDDSITPVYGNSGYRAKFVPEDTQHYKTIIVRVKIPVKKRTLKKSMITVKKTRAYTGAAIKNNYNAKDKGVKLVLGKDFKITYWNNKKPGNASMTFKGIGNYKGTVKAVFTIKKRSVKGLSYHYAKTKVYNGKLRTVQVSIKNGNVTLKKNKDYTILFSKNKEMGTASITICGIGNYVGKKILYFDIIPSKPKVSKATKTGKTMKLKFKGSALVKGYYVYISTSKKFTKSKTLEYRLSGDGFQIKKMKKGTYYIRVKGYGVKNGKSYVSGYSKAKKVTIKK